jgi:hypothetical protein
MVSTPDFYGTTRVYQMISGSDGSSYDGGTGYTTNSGSYGWFLPDISTILLNARALELNDNQGINLVPNTSSNTYFINNPTVFPTTIGLYNDSNDLLAVAKLSKPLQKDFTKEALIRVKLDF